MRNNLTNLFQVDIPVFLFLSEESGLVKQLFPNMSISVVDGEQDDLNEKTKKNNKETTNHKLQSICIRLLLQQSGTNAVLQDSVASLHLQKSKNHWKKQEEVFKEVDCQKDYSFHAFLVENQTDIW